MTAAKNGMTGEVLGLAEGVTGVGSEVVRPAEALCWALAVLGGPITR